MSSYCSYLQKKKKKKSKRITNNVWTTAKIQTCIVLVCLHTIKKPSVSQGNRKGSRRQSTEQNMGQEETPGKQIEVGEGDRENHAAQEDKKKRKHRGKP